MNKINVVFEVLDFKDKKSQGIETELIELLINYRLKLKKEEKWKLADKIRDDLKKIGIQLKDTPEGTVWELIP